MKFSHVNQGITHVINHLSNITQICNVEINKSNKSITWNGRRSGIQRGMYYPFEYQYLLDHHQYSLLLADSSFFQFYYYFNSRNELIEARLAYYPRPIHTIDSEDDLTEAANAAIELDNQPLFDHLYNWIDLLEITSKVPANTSHIRFDFDKKALTHDPSHLQFGGVQNFRIPSDFVPQPLAFVELCNSLLSGCSNLDKSHISFAQNHCYDLTRTNQIISLGRLK